MDATYEAMKLASDPRLTEKRVDDLRIALAALKFVIDMEGDNFNVARERLAYERLRELPE